MSKCTDIPNTPQQNINNYDKISTNIDNTKLVLVTNTGIKEYSIDSVLNE